jgi:hypothetical protein
LGATATATDATAAVFANRFKKERLFMLVEILRQIQILVKVVAVSLGLECRRDPFKGEGDPSQIELLDVLGWLA